MWLDMIEEDRKRNARRAAELFYARFRALVETGKAPLMKSELIKLLEETILEAL